MGRRKKNDVKIPEELIKLIKVTPEMIEASRNKLKYKIIPKPEEKLNKVPKDMLWCCYCGDWKKFGRSEKFPKSSYKRCETCGISIEDYYIKNYNNLWQK